MAEFIKLDKYFNDKRFQEVQDALDYTEYDFDNVILEEYSGEREVLEGRCQKEFYRTDSKLFQKLIKELKDNEKSTYVTYANSVIKEGVIPEKLSVLIKTKKLDENTQRNIISEVLSSQILNYFECSTPYNMAFKNGLDEIKLLSVDYISENEEFNSFMDLKLYGWYAIENVVAKTKEFLDSFDGVLEENKNQVLGNYVLSYYVRKYLLIDSDFDYRNAGLLINKKDKTLKYINYDFEFGCLLDAEREFKDYVLQDSLEYLKRKFPQVYNRFTYKIKQMVEVKDEVKNNLDYKNKKHEFAVKTILNNAKYLLSQISIIEKFKYDHLLK